MPRQSGGNGWDSPHLQNEIVAYSEFCTHTWGTTQLDLKEDYTAVGTLLDGIKHKEEMVNNLRQEVGQPPEPSYFVRKNGEESLSDHQVRARRGRELAREQAPHYNKIKTLEEEIMRAYTEVSERQNRILEINNNTRIICRG